MNTYNKIKDSEITKKVGSGLSSAYETTKENVKNPDLLKENLGKMYQGTKNKINQGIEKVKDPEFRSNVKTSIQNGFENAMDSISNRFVDVPPEGLNRNNDQQTPQNTDSPFDVLSDDEEDSDLQIQKEEKKEEQDDKEVQVKDAPLITEVPKDVEVPKEKEIQPEALDEVKSL